MLCKHRVNAHTKREHLQPLLLEGRSRTSVQKPQRSTVSYTHSWASENLRGLNYPFFPWRQGLPLSLTLT